MATYAELVNIDVEEESAGVLGSEGLVDGGDLLARSAPRSEKRGEREGDTKLVVGSKWSA